MQLELTCLLLVLSQCPLLGAGGVGREQKTEEQLGLIAMTCVLHALPQDGEQLNCGSALCFGFFLSVVCVSACVLHSASLLGLGWE